jgi:hypothetical protein
MGLELSGHGSESWMHCLAQSGRKETVLDLAKYVDKGVAVKLSGGREGQYHQTRTS